MMGSTQLFTGQNGGGVLIIVVLNVGVSSEHSNLRGSIASLLSTAWENQIHISAHMTLEPGGD